MNLDVNYLIGITMELLNIPSPVGYTDEAMERIGTELDELGVSYNLTRKGAILGFIPGEDNKYKKMISAHVDTLGAMVKRIKPNGRLELVNLGGVNWGGVEGENILVHTLDGDVIEGTIVPVKSSVHIYGDEARELPRNSTTMEVRLDEEIYSKEDTEQLGVRVGDFVSFEPRTVVTGSGYIKSRFIDDKICIAQILGYIKYLKDNNLKPKNGLYIYISNYEEIGHGVSVVPDDMDEFIALDIGLVGEDALGDEKKVSIAAKDFKTPYDLSVRLGLTEAAELNNIGYTVDVYNRYGSDASAAILQGFDFKCGCIGPSVESSHHYERTHIDGVLETIKLLVAYL
ncbi:M42 family metallopeptidase [Fusobacterium sp.]|uniref:M42 family metallopeptidase n=1 Tax=Fusobacterium sp. TaxID=68766 RepID=UPI00262ADE6F|nr:M42 family metallopeptidase [Fusobacterium sp.]